VARARRISSETVETTRALGVQLREPLALDAPFPVDGDPAPLGANDAGPGSSALDLFSNPDPRLVDRAPRLREEPTNASLQPYPPRHRAARAYRSLHRDRWRIGILGREFEVDPGYPLRHPDPDRR